MMFHAKFGKMVPVDSQRIAAGIVALDPDVMVAGNQRFLARQIIEELQTFFKVLSGTDIARQDQPIGRSFP